MRIGIWVSDPVEPLTIPALSYKVARSVYRYPGYNRYMNKSNTRKCIWCQELKNISDFDKYDKSSDGYRSQCKLCLNRSKKSGYIK